MPFDLVWLESARSDMKRLYKLFPWGISVVLLAACWGSPKEVPPMMTESTDITENIPEPVIGQLDTDKDISRMNIQELRVIRSFVYARHGMLLENDLSEYWKQNTVWYDTLSHTRWEKINAGIVEDTVILSDEAQNFVQNIDRRINLLKRDNYIHINGGTVANVLNIANIYQYPQMTQVMMDDLAMNHFALVRDSAQQLFQTYQANNKQGLPNFVTTDLMLQLAHIYNAYLLGSAEQEYFAPALTNLCFALHKAALKQANRETKPELKHMGYYNAVFYAIPYTLLSGKNLKMSGVYQDQMEEELAYIAQQEDHSSEFLSLSDFPYSAFRPTGHYTRTAELRRYIKAIRWLQLAPYCRSNKAQLQQAVYAATLLIVKETSAPPLIGAYRNLFEPLTYLTGKPAAPSLLYLAEFLQKEGVNNFAKAMDTKTTNRVEAMLKRMPHLQTNVVPEPCPTGIYFIPQPHDTDEQVLQALTDKNKNADRAYPKGLDVFAAFGSSTAFNRLFIDNQEDTLWSAYPGLLAKERDKLRHFNQWNSSAYNKWMECLLVLQQPANTMPLTRNPAWNGKNLNTALASWSKLKHDVVLYGEVPEYPEPKDTLSGASDVPSTLVVGYVEPNVAFWRKLTEWVELTDKICQKYGLTNDIITEKTTTMHRYVSFMEHVSRKEISGERLTENEFDFIAHIGDSIEQFTLSMVKPEIDRWAWVGGADRTNATYHELYQRNIPGCSQNGVLYSGTGLADNIYVIVDINGFLYLTKGAVFNYHEIMMPQKQVLTEERWNAIIDR